MPVSRAGAILPGLSGVASPRARRLFAALWRWALPGRPCSRKMQDRASSAADETRRSGGVTRGKDEMANQQIRQERYAAAEKIKDDGDLAAAVAALEVLVADEPDFALAHSALGAWCTRLERHTDAVCHARRACELEPKDPFSYTALSVACMRAGLIAEAEEALARSRMLQG